MAERGGEEAEREERKRANGSNIPTGKPATHETDTTKNKLQNISHSLVGHESILQQFPTETSITRKAHPVAPRRGYVLLLLTTLGT